MYAPYNCPVSSRFFGFCLNENPLSNLSEPANVGMSPFAFWSSTAKLKLALLPSMFWPKSCYLCFARVWNALHVNIWLLPQFTCHTSTTLGLTNYLGYGEITSRHVFVISKRGSFVFCPCPIIMPHINGFLVRSPFEVWHVEVRFATT